MPHNLNSQIPNRQSPSFCNRQWAIGNRQSAFTLTELLVAIGIIAILIGVLVPTVSTVRNRANAAKSQQIISALVAAIERYHQDFRAYPGPLANSVVGLAPALTNVNGAGTSPTITGSENLMLALSGGLTDASTYDAANLDRGIRSPLGNATAKKYGPYVDAMERSNGAFADDKGNNANDTNIPEYLDGFPIPLPILYLRANIGRSGVCADDGSEQYDTRAIRGYTTVNLGGKTHTNLQSAANANTANYFESTSFPDQARQKDAYILIAAGVDRIYGTDDDITNFGAK